MCALADEFGTFRASLLQPMFALRPKFMLRSMLILSRSCCIDLRTARCPRAYWTMFNGRFAPTSGHGSQSAGDDGAMDPIAITDHVTRSTVP